MEENEISKAGIDWENKFYGRLKKEGLCYKRFDRKRGSGKCIDCYVYRRNEVKRGFLCEIKSINSAGFDPEINAHISSRDSNFSNAISIDDHDEKINKRKMLFDYDHERFISKIEDTLQKAVEQYGDSDVNSFTLDKKGRPFVVAISFDFVFFSDQVDFKQVLTKFPLISAILILERGHERKKISKRHLSELNLLYKNKKLDNLEDKVKKWGEDYEGTPDSVAFMVHLNPVAKKTFRPNSYFNNFISDYS